MSRVHVCLCQMALACAALGSTPAALAVPPIDQLGSFSHVCAGSANGNSFEGLHIEWSFVPGLFQCDESFEPAFTKNKAQVSVTGVGGATASAKARAAASHMSLTLQSNAPSNGSEGAKAITGFTDRLTIDAPGYTGQSGALTYKLKVKGRVEALAGKGAAALKVYPIHPQSPGNTMVTWGARLDVPPGFVDVDAVAEITTTFTFGTPFLLTTVAYGASGAYASGYPGAAAVTFSQTKAIQLKGVSSVTSAGLPVSGYSLVSEAGFNWLP
jgi:hypothetical protein